MLQVHLLNESVGEQELFEARQKAKTEISLMLSGESLIKKSDIVYDEEGKPRPRRPYDESYRDDALGPLQAETVPGDDFFNPFPGLQPPLG